jgi:hypothetical protein
MNASTLRLRWAAILLAALPLAGLTGCVVVAAGAAGAGAVAWVRGELDATLSNRFDAVEHATNRAIEQLQLAKVNETRSAIDAEFTARTGQDKRINIRINRTAENITRVRIRVGLVGDENLSRVILDKIKANL